MVVLDDQNTGAVFDGRARDRWEAELVGRERRGGERQEEDQRPHETPPGRGGSSFAGRPDGIGSSTTTVRCAGWRWAAATRLTSSAPTFSHAASSPSMAR